MVGGGKDGYCTNLRPPRDGACGWRGAGLRGVVAAADDLYPQHLVGEGLIVEGEFESSVHLRLLHPRRRVASGHARAGTPAASCRGGGGRNPN